MDLVRATCGRRTIVTRDAIENAIASVAATGGSTNGVLHLLAIAHEFGIPLDIDEFDAHRRPDADRGRPEAGRPLHRRRPVRRGRHRRSSCASCSSATCIARRRANVDGRTIAEIAAAAVETPGQRWSADRPADQADRRPGDPARLARARGLRRQARRPRARHHPRAGARLRLGDGLLRGGQARSGSSPATSSSSATRARSAGPGCRRCSSVTGGARGRGPGRVGGAAHRRPVLRRHPRPDDRPRRARGGPRRADRPRRGGRRDRHRRRRAAAGPRGRRRASSPRGAARWPPPAPRYTGGVMAKYAALVSSASEGAVTTGRGLARERSRRSEPEPGR